MLIVGNIVSLLTGRQKVDDLKQGVLTPLYSRSFLCKWMPKDGFSNWCYLISHLIGCHGLRSSRQDIKDDQDCISTRPIEHPLKTHIRMSAKKLLHHHTTKYLLTLFIMRHSKKTKTKWQNRLKINMLTSDRSTDDGQWKTYDKITQRMNWTEKWKKNILTVRQKVINKTATSKRLCTFL